MKKSNLIITILVIVAAGFFLWALLSSKSGPAPANNTQLQNPTVPAHAYEAKSDSEGGVEVAVQPLDLASSEWSFSVGFNTHAGSLDMDLLKIVSLTDDRGDTFTPVQWNGPPPGGHHRNGTLVFPAPSSTPKSITVSIMGIGGIPQRTFSWDLP